MARTQAGEQLAEQHRLAQLQVRAQALRDYLALWPAWGGDDDSFVQVAVATYTLVRLYRGMSASLAASFYEAFRFAEGITGTPTIRRAPDLTRREVIGTLWLVGRNRVRDRAPAVTRDEISDELEDLSVALKQAIDSAFVDTSGVVTRLVLNGGRETIVETARADPQAVGWARITDGDPCAFCLVLASRGAVYKEDTVGFQAHDHCGCGAVPTFHRDDPLPHNARWREEYNRAVRAATAAGDLRRGTSNDLLNAVRRYRAGSYSRT